MRVNPALIKDSYKISHKFMYKEGIEEIYSNFTARGSRIPSIDRVVVFAIQYFLREYLNNRWDRDFFGISKDKVVAKYKKRADTMLSKDAITVDHIAALHELGYLPLLIKALPEGTLCPIRIPMLTIKNTLPDYSWLTNMIETNLSLAIWHPQTSATKSFYLYKQLYEDAKRSNPEMVDFVKYQAHDFSMRGQTSLESAMASGAGHLLSFRGTDTIPAIDWLEEYYDADEETDEIGSSVPACYDETTEVLTNSGFKLFSNLLKEDSVAQYHNDGSISFVKPDKYFENHYNGDMIHYKYNKYNYVDLLVTPNHRMIRRNEQGKIQIFEADSSIYQFRQGYSNKNKMIVAGKTKIISEEFSELDRLRIAFQADGSFPSRKEKYNGNRTGCFPIRFSLKKQRKIIRLREILQNLNYEYTEHCYEDNYYHFWIKSDEKFIKDFSWVDIDKISSKWANNFINELQYWDGTSSKTTNSKVKRKGIIYNTTNLSCAEKVQIIGCIAGCKTNWSEYQDQRKDYNRDKIYTVSITPNKDWVGGVGIEKNKIAYNGKVYCVSVPTGMIIVRRNKVIAICGNSEHSVMQSAGKENERETFRRIMQDIYPKGIVSIVSDTWDFWNVVTNIIPSLKDVILARDGKVVLRPDSGVPANIICGDPNYSVDTPQYKGVIECLWDIFGGTITSTDCRQLDPHIGTIYGDSMNEEVMKEINERLWQKRFASTNYVGGVGSYCIDPESLLLYSDLSWRKAGNVKSGDELIAFDENPFWQGKQPTRRYKLSDVECSSIIEKECFLIETDIGDPIICSEDHSWLIWANNRNQSNMYFDKRKCNPKDSRGPGLAWGITHELNKGDKIAFLSKPWNRDFSHSGGWLAGIFDGEACFSLIHGRSEKRRIPAWKLIIAQNEGETFNRILREIEERRFTFQYNGKRKCKKITISGGFIETLRFLGTIHPYRLMTKLPSCVTDLPSLSGHGTYRLATITSIRRIGKRMMSSIQTSSRTFIVNGYLSHNCYQYVTRDTFGSAVKNTSVTIGGERQATFKDPKTDSGLKKSARGYLRVNADLTLSEDVTPEEENEGLLQVVFKDSDLFNQQTFTEVRNRLMSNLEG